MILAKRDYKTKTPSRLLLSELKNKPTLLQSQFVGQDDVEYFENME